MSLLITIVILIILATVTINAVIGDNGLINQAQQAKDYSSNSTESEYEGMNRLYDEYANVMVEDNEIPVFKSEIERAKESGEVFETNTILTDDLENDVIIPGGFHVAEDSGTKVEEGIVIEDNAENQFVWIPVGIYQTSSGSKTNNLSRRTFTEDGATEVNGDDGIEDRKEPQYLYYGEGNENSVAKDQIEGFKTSVNNNRGYYIGRYETGTEIERTSNDDELTTPLVQANKNAYVWITRDEAKTQSEEMYNGNSFIISELISSYAWDTALNFICQNNEEGYLLATTVDSKYGNIGTGIKELTGGYLIDTYCNIHDLLGNCREWTTEYSATANSTSNYPCTSRGASFYYDNIYVMDRNDDLLESNGVEMSFRIQLYIK